MPGLISSSQSSHCQIEIQQQAASRSGIVNMQAPVYRLAIVWMWCYCMPQIADILQSLIFIRDNYHYDTCLWHINDRIVLLPPQNVTSLFPMLRLLRADITQNSDARIGSMRECLLDHPVCVKACWYPWPVVKGWWLYWRIIVVMGSVFSSNLLGNSLMSAMAFL